MDIKKPIISKAPDRLGVTIKRLPQLLVDDLNKHVQAEAYSSQIYLAMASWLEDILKKNLHICIKYINIY